VLGVAGALALMCVGPALAQGEPGPQEPAQAPQVTVQAGGVATAVHDSEALAQKLNNPVAALVSVPFQFNWDEGLGPDDEGRRFLLNIQPVMPFKLNDDWNLIARVIMPFIGQPVLIEGAEPSFGMGDITLSTFFSPNKGGLIWGAGPVVLLPVTSDPLLGSGKYGLGPSVVVLKQEGPFTVGALWNQVWSVGGDAGRNDVNQMFLQPFISWGKKGWTLAANTETSINWEAESDQWTVPINLTVSKVVEIGTHPLSVGAGVRYYADAPPGGPSWGFRLFMTLLFPTGA
jgi:hypothetical protein